MDVTFDIVVAASDGERGIGKDRKIPWRLPSDMEYFKNLTVGKDSLKQKNCVIMGRGTYLSIPKKFRPLTDRTNIVLTTDEGKMRDSIKQEGAIIASSLTDALVKAADIIDESVEENTNFTKGNIFVIGGESVYKEAILHPGCRKIYYTLVLIPKDMRTGLTFDRFFPHIPETLFELEVPDHSIPIRMENGYGCQFLVYKRK